MNSLVPTEWITDELVRFCDIVGGGTPDRAVHEYWGGQIPWVSPTEVTSLVSKYISKTKEGLTQLGLDKSSAKLHPPGTLLMTSRASIGYVAINTVPMATNQGFQSLRCKDGALADYMYQYITWVRPELERLSAGSTFSEISSVNVKRLRVTLPPLPEQQKIATILSSVDNVIEKTRAQIDKLKDLKTGMMQELLTKGIGHTEFKDSPVGRIPACWEVTSFFDAISIQSGQVDPKEPKYKNLILIAPNHVESDTGRLIKMETAIEQNSISGKFLCKPGTLIYSKIRPRLKKAVLVDFECLCSADMYPLVCRDSLTPRFLKYLILDERFSFFATTVSERSNIPKINRTELAEFNFALPPIDEQLKISKIISAIDDKYLANYIKMLSVLNLKKALMQDLLTGKVRVNLTDKESAVV